MVALFCLFVFFYIYCFFVREKNRDVHRMAACLRKVATRRGCYILCPWSPFLSLGVRGLLRCRVAPGVFCKCLPGCVLVWGVGRACLVWPECAPLRCGCRSEGGSGAVASGVVQDASTGSGPATRGRRGALCGRSWLFVVCDPMCIRGARPPCERAPGAGRSC